MILITLFVISAIYLFPIITKPINPFDESLILAGAERIYKGHIIYKDFWTAYPPGQFYTVALLFKIFGTSVLSARIYDIAIKSLIPVVIFSIIRLKFSSKLALAGWVMSLVWIGFIDSYVYPVFTSLLFIYVGAYFFLRYIEGNEVYWLIFSAISIVFSILFRHVVGGMAAVGIFLILALRKVMNTYTPWTPMLYYVVTIIFTGLPLLIYFFLSCGIQPMINDLILYPANIYPKVRWLPYPTSLYIETLPFFVFPFVLLISFITSLTLLVKNKVCDKVTCGLLLFSVFGFFFFNLVRVRSDIYHLLPVSLTSIILVPILFSVLSRGQPLKTRRTMVIFAFFVAVFGFVFFDPVYMKMRSFSIDYLVIPSKSKFSRAGYSKLSSDLQNVVAYIQNNTSETDSLYVGVKNHDQFIKNAIVVYFIAGRNYASKYHELVPGLTNTLRKQQEIVKELEDTSVKVIITTQRYWHETNDTIFDPGFDVLDDYISTNYELKEKYGGYEVWMKKLCEH